MPTYEFRCHVCADTFEVARPMSESGRPAPCPDGHTDTVKLLSAISLARSPTAAGSAPAPATVGGGGCCGGGCCGGG